jgi:hypothetical protein
VPPTTAVGKRLTNSIAYGQGFSLTAIETATLVRGAIEALPKGLREGIRLKCFCTYVTAAAHPC